MENVHSGHRKRLKARFAKEGLDSFEDHNFLELLLFYAIPRKDTNPIAHRLMNHFGSLAAIFDAPLDEIAKIGGLSVNTAMLIKIIPSACRRYMVSKTSFSGCLNSVEKAGAYMIPRFFGRSNECVFLICLDAKRKILGCTMISEGTANSTGVNVRKVVETALNFNASSVILSHNHTSGIAVPSPEDDTTTRTVYDALNAIGIELLDHIVVADDDFVSMAQNGSLGSRAGWA